MRREREIRRVSMTWVVGTLRRQEMPAEEIREILTTGDPEMVRRHLELHRERMQERLAEQQQTITSLERTLTEGLIERSSAPIPCHTEAAISSSCS